MLFLDIYFHICNKASETDVTVVFNSEAHASAWLHLKANLSPSDLKKIKKTFSLWNASTSESTVDGQDPLHSSRNFFSKVAIN